MVMRSFSQYNLDHFISLHYYEGGLATSQVICMFNSIIEERNEEIRFQAALRGIKLKEGTSTKTQGREEIVPMFGDPDSYSNMSAEEREALTQDMMTKHRNWVASKGGSV